MALKCIKILLYNSWFKELGDRFSPVVINTTYHRIYFLNKVKETIQECSQIGTKTVNMYD